MARFSTTATSPRPPAEVFEFLADMRNAARWDPGVSRAEVTLGSAPRRPVGPGTVFEVTLRLAGRPRPVRYRVSAWEPPNRVVLEAFDPAFHSLDTVRVEAAPGGGSVARYEAVVTPLGLWRAAAPLIAVAFARIGRRAAIGLARELGR